MFSPQYVRSAAAERRERPLQFLAAAFLIGLAGVACIPTARDTRHHVVATMPCAVLPAETVGAVVGASVTLDPTSGTVCRYAGGDWKSEVSAIVVRQRDGRYRVSVMPDGPESAPKAARLEAMTRSLAIAR